MNNTQKANFYRQQSLDAARRIKDDWSLRGGESDAAVTRAKASHDADLRKAQQLREQREQAQHPQAWFTRPFGPAWPNWQVCEQRKDGRILVIAQGMEERNAVLFWTLSKDAGLPDNSAETA